MADEVIVKVGESSRARSPSADSIPLYLINGVATVWDAQVAATLHCTYNISGIRAGTLPGVTQQNGFLGLPLTLMQEETAYLVLSGIAHLVPVLTEPTFPSAEQAQRQALARVSRIRAMEAAAQKREEAKARLGKQAFAQGGEKARAKREARARAKAEKAQAGVSDVVGDEARGGLFGEANDKEEPIHTSTTDRPQPPSSSSGHFHDVPALPPPPSSSTPTSSPPFGQPITSLPHPLFPFPSSPRQHALCQTFATLLDAHSLRMGLGPRFGGEYLVYPGDYLRYHAHFTSQVLVRDEVLRPAEIVAWGRLGTGTKKAGLLCCWDDGVRTGEDGGEEGREARKGEVEFYSLEWANFG